MAYYFVKVEPSLVIIDCYPGLMFIKIHDDDSLGFFVSFFFASQQIKFTHKSCFFE